MKLQSNWESYTTSSMTGVYDLKLDHSNYCLISLLSNIEKILTIYSQTLYTTFNNKITYNLQFRSSKQYSTNHALINITENIRKALDNGN